MVSFRVMRRRDAFEIAVARVEASSAVVAAHVAQAREDQLDWHVVGVEAFEGASFVTLDEEGRELAGAEVGDV